ncbi:MAG: exodeoxyribonuclease VII small subunit [Lachnospiraceae bacterium]|nr:exodeoxyribonuclease VII small subunit [Lachnospiraceae bacterium]
MAKSKFQIEEAYQELDTLIAHLESEETSLSDAFSDYKKGMKLLEKCQATLDTIEKEVILLREDGEEE